MKYEEALTELQSIVKELEVDNASIDNLAFKVKRAKELVELCKTKLRDTEAALDLKR